MDFQEQTPREVSWGIDVLVVGDRGTGRMAGERSPATHLGMVNMSWMQCWSCVVDKRLNYINVVVQMTVDEAREICSHSWMKEALDVFVCQFKPQQEEEAVSSCRLELCRSEESRRGCWPSFGWRWMIW